MIAGERELRDALHARAGGVPVGRADEPGLGRRLVAARRRRTRMRLASVAVALVLLLGGAALASVEGDEPGNVVAGPDQSSTTTVPEPSSSVATAPGQTLPPLPASVPTSAVPGTTVTAGPTTTGARTPTTTAAPLPPLPADALWPEPYSQQTYSTPEQATRDFARLLLFMETPQLGPPQVTGSDATVVVRALPTASRTTVVTLRQIAQRGWVVVGCAAPSIRVDEPTAGTRVDSPFTIRGHAQAFEGNLELYLFLTAEVSPGSASATGGSDEMQRFETTMEFPAAGIREGSNGPQPAMLVVREPRVDDATQGPLAVTIVRVVI